MKSSTLITFLLIVVLQLSAIYGNDRDDEPKPIDGASILNMGRTYKNPLLRLVGTAMANEKKYTLGKFCGLYRCSEWSEWSTCSVESKGSFGMTKRTRECGKGPTFCPDKGSKKVTLEMDSRVCMGEDCPTGYTKTENGYCFLAAPSKMTRDAADEFCESKQGFVINVNSKEKDEDFRRFRSDNGFSGYYDRWIDGRRVSISSPWVYKYEKEVVGFSKWGPSEPSNASGELFIVESSNDRWYDVGDRSCYVFCEYI